MARIRTIRPEFFRNEALADLEPLTRLLFVGLWTLADVDGRIEDRPRRIKAELFPYDNCDVDGMLADLADARFIHRYEVDGLRCIWVCTFKKHQRITGKESETSSVIPRSPFDDDGETTGKRRGNTGETPGDKPAPTRETTEQQLGAQERKGKEGKGNTPTEGASAPVAFVIDRAGAATAITEAHINELLLKHPGVDATNNVRRLCNWTRKHPRPAGDDHIAWIDSKVAQLHEELLAKQLAKSEAPEPDKYPGFTPEEIEEAKKLEAILEARNAARQQSA